LLTRHATAGFATRHSDNSEYDLEYYRAVK
jgi:hypothetical protein